MEYRNLFQLTVFSSINKIEVHADFTADENKKIVKLCKDLIKTPHCEKSDVLYLVKTARTNFGLRQLLRSNRPKSQNGIKTQMLFLIGFDSKETTQEKKIVESEIQEFGDFIIGDYFDAYQNLTKKVLHF